MFALIYKDFETYRKYYLGMILFFIAYGIYMVYSTGNVIFAPAIFFLMVFMVSATSISGDEQEDIYKFIFTAPISKKEYILSKYLLGIVLSILGGISTFFVVKNNLAIPSDFSLLISIVSMGVSFLILDLINPIILKFGTRNGMFVMLVLYMTLLFAASEFDNLIKNGLKVFEKIQALSPMVLASLLLVAITVITIISIIISIKIVEKKEF